jgi:hypothetical protein
MPRENLIKKLLLEMPLAERQAFLDDSFLWLASIEHKTENDRKIAEIFFQKLKAIYTVDTIPEEWFISNFILYRFNHLFIQWLRRIPKPSRTVQS